MFFTSLQTLLQASAFFILLTLAFAGTAYILFNVFVWPDDPTYYIRHVSYIENLNDFDGKKAFILLQPDLDPMELRTGHTFIYTSGMRIGSSTSLQQYVAYSRKPTFLLIAFRHF